MVYKTLCIKDNYLKKEIYLFTLQVISEERQNQLLLENSVVTSEWMNWEWNKSSGWVFVILQSEPKFVILIYIIKIRTTGRLRYREGHEESSSLGTSVLTALRFRSSDSHRHGGKERGTTWARSRIMPASQPSSAWPAFRNDRFIAIHSWSSETDLGDWWNL